MPPEFLLRYEFRLAWNFVGSSRRMKMTESKHSRMENRDKPVRENIEAERERKNERKKMRWQ